MSYTVEIPIEIFNAIIDRGAYYELYLDYVYDGLSPKEAYEKVERSLNQYGAKRFSSYYSFRKNIWRMPKSLKIYRTKKASPIPTS